MEVNQILNGPSISQNQFETLSLLINNCRIQSERVNYMCAAKRRFIIHQNDLFKIPSTSALYTSNKRIGYRKTS